MQQSEFESQDPISESQQHTEYIDNADSDHSHGPESNLPEPDERFVTLKELKDELEQAQLLMQNRIVPMDLIEKFTKLIQYFLEDPIGRLYTDEAYKRFFFSEFLSGLVKKVCTIRDIQTEHQPVIHQLVMLLVEFFGQEIDRDNVDMAEAMRWLFNQNSTLHTYMFQHNQLLLSQQDIEAIIAKLSQEELEWRNFKEGDKVDALKVDEEYNLKMWSKAEIIEIEDGILRLQFEHDLPPHNSRKVPWYSADLAPYNTRTLDDEWRIQLEVGDYVDAYDSTKAWYQSIIQKKTFLKHDDLLKDVLVYQVGFRMYHPEGNKEDDSGRKYFGWSEKFDENIFANSPRLQKFQTYAPVIGDLQKDHNSARYEEQVDDMMDKVIYEDLSKRNEAFALPRRKYKSSLLVKFLNKFGEIGGFQKILDKISLDDKDATTTTIEIMFYYIDAINASNQMYNRMFMEEFLPKLEAAVRKKILTLSPQALRVSKKDNINNIVIHLFRDLKGRLGIPYHQREQEVALFNLEVASLFLRQNFLEKRIEGAKFIQEVCKNANLSTFHVNTDSYLDSSSRNLRLSFAQEVIDKIKQGKVLYEIFSQERSHFELVQRSDELIKLFIMQNSLTQEELEYVWGATKLDETTRLEIFKHFHELSNRLRENEMVFIIEKLAQVPLNRVVMQELDLVHELARRSISAEQTYSALAIDYFWKIGFSNQENVDKAIVNYSINSISDIIKNWNNEQKHVYVERLLSNLANNIEGLLSIKMLKKILQNFTQPIKKSQSNLQQSLFLESRRQPDNSQLEDGSEQDNSKDGEENQNAPYFKNKNNYICHLEWNYRLLDNVFENFKHYIFKARQIYRDKITKDPSIAMRSIFDQVLCDKFIHSEQISERLEFLRFIISNSNVDLQMEQLSLLWDELIVHNLSIQDSEMLYRWLREICDQITKQGEIEEQRSLVEFFQKKLASESNAFQAISVDGFACLQSFIIFVNEFNDKIVRLFDYSTQNYNNDYTQNLEGKELKSYSFNQASKLSQDDYDLEFQINCEPSQIDGIQAIWKIATEANEIRVYEKAMSFLVKLYQNVSYGFVSKLPEFDDEFFAKCITMIRRLKDEINSRSEELKKIYEKDLSNQSMSSSILSLSRILPPEERKILRYLTLIKEYIRESERNGTLGVKSHSSLLRGDLLDCVQVNSSLGSGKESHKYELAVQSNMTVLDFKLKIASLNPSYSTSAPIIPSAIILYRFAGVATISEADHGKTLADLRFKKNEVLNCYENKYYNNWSVPLLNRSGTDFNSISRLVFSDVFYQFAIDEVNQETGQILKIMTKGGCAEFIRSCTDEQIVTEQDERVENTFDKYNEARDDRLLLDEFLNFYLDCCKAKDFVVRENLLYLNIRYNLLRQKQDNEQRIINLQQRSSKYEMPRCKLSSNSHFFEEIFSLLNNVNEIAQSSWQLLKQLTTQPELYHKIERLDLEPDFSWDKIIDTSSIYKILYTLQIIESMLEDIPESQKTNFEAIQRKSMWIERFLSVGGFQEIIKLFDTSMSMISKKNVDSLTRFEKNFLEYMLKLVRIFIISAFSASDQSVFQLLDLVKRTSSIQEEAPKSEQQPAEKEKKNQAVGDDIDEDLYSTPQKKTSQNVVIGNQRDIVPEITQELLFGESYAGVTADNVAVEVKDSKKVNSSTTANGNSASGLAEAEGDRFSLLSKVMGETSLGDTIIIQINFKDLHNELLEIISSMLGKKELTQDDALIMENNLSLWGAILMKNSELIDEFYKFTRPEDKAGMLGVKNVEQLITHGLYTYKNMRVREEFANTFAFLAKNVSSTNGRSLLVYLLELLQKNFPREDHYYTTRESKQFFELLSQLIDEFFEVKKKQKKSQTQLDQQQEAIEFDIYQLLQIAIEKMKKHQSKETKNSQAEDKTLIGYFNIISKLIGHLSQDNKVRLLEIFEATEIIKELFYEQLFFDPKSLTSLDNKCKTKESRTACYSLLQKVIESLEPKELADFINNDLWSILKDLKKPKSWKYVPADNSKSSTSYCGIRNLGNICYMIAMLQQFFMVPQFRYQLLRAEDDSRPDIVSYKGQDIDDNMLKQLQRMFGYLELSEKQEFNPTEFCFSFKDYEGRPTNTAIQADTQEFLNIFFDRLENILKPTSQRYLLDGVFGGNNCSQLICQSCGKVKNIKESFYNLSVPVKDRKGLNNSLAKMIEGSIINDYKCDACNQKVDVFKRTLIGDTPNVLIVHLQRLVFNFDTFQNDKVNTRFDFPNSLDLSEYSFKHVMEQEGKQVSGSDEQEQEYVDRLLQMEKSEFIYKLVGVIIHRGTGQHGHYWSLINTKRGSEELDESKPDWIQTERDPWREFNDEQVKYFSFNDLKTEAFGGANDISGGGDLMDDDMSSYLFNIGGGANSYGKNAYILVYERQKKKDLVVLNKKLVPKEQEAQSLECADTANSRDSQDPGEVEMEEIIEQLNQPYRKIDAFVPEWIRAEVSLDNIIFLMDRYIYCEPFFNFMKAIFKHIAGKVVISQHNYSLDYMPHFVNLKRSILKLNHKLVFELLAYYYYNNQLSDILYSFQSIIQFCDSAYGLTHGNKSLLAEYMDYSYFSDNLKQFTDVAIKCTDSTSRNYICRFTSTIINKIYQIWDDAQTEENEEVEMLKQYADNLIVQFISMLDEPVAHENWSKLSQFLQMIYDIALGGKNQCRRILSSTDTIPYLVDFMLGNRSPKVRNQKQRKNLIGEDPDLEPVVRLVCLLTRYTLTKAMVKNEQSWDIEHNPPPSSLLGYQFNEQNRYNHFVLSDEAYKLIFESSFIDIIQYMGYDTFAVGNFLAHLSYKSLEVTRIICEKQLKGISKNDFDRVKYYLDAIAQVVQVKDELQINKLEWIFGLCQLNWYDNYNALPNEPKTRLGCKLLLSNNDEAYTYRTFLSSADSIDSLLHLLWRYKGKMDSYIVQCLVSLLNIIISDDKITEWFSKIPGPSYQYARYTDWIKPYLEEQLADAKRGYAGSFSKEKEENAIMALNLHEKYQKFLDKQHGYSQSEAITKATQSTQKTESEVQEDSKVEEDIQEKEVDIEENVKNLINQAIQNTGRQIKDTKTVQDSSLAIVPENSDAIYNKYNRVIPCNPAPYIIIESVQEYQSDETEWSGVSLQTINLDCTYTESKPTGYYNLAMPKNLFSNYRRYDNLKQTTSGKGREHELQAKCIDNYFSSQNIAKAKNVNLGNAGEKQIVDDNNQWSKVNRNNFDNDIQPIDEDTGYSQDNEDVNPNHYGEKQDAKMHNSGIDDDEDFGEDRDDILNQGMNNFTNDLSYGYERDKQDKVYDEESKQNIELVEIEVFGYKMMVAKGVTVEDKFSAKTPAQSQAPQDAGHDEQPEEDVKIEWPYGISTSEGLVQKFIATNNNFYPVKICLEFLDPYADSELQDLIEDLEPPKERYCYPQGIQEYHLNPNQTKTILIIQKADPWRDERTYEKYVRLSVCGLENHNDDKQRQNQREEKGEEPVFTTQQLQVIDETEDQVDGEPMMNVSDQNIQNVIDDIPLNDQAGDTGGESGANILDNGMKECKACTYHNESFSIRCEVCDSKL